MLEFRMFPITHSIATDILLRLNDEFDDLRWNTILENGELIDGWLKQDYPELTKDERSKVYNEVASFYVEGLEMESKVQKNLLLWYANENIIQVADRVVLHRTLDERMLYLQLISSVYSSVSYGKRFLTNLMPSIISINKEHEDCMHCWNEAMEEYLEVIPQVFIRYLIQSKLYLKIKNLAENKNENTVETASDYAKAILCMEDEDDSDFYKVKTDEFVDLYNSLSKCVKWTKKDYLKANEELDDYLLECSEEILDELHFILPDSYCFSIEEDICLMCIQHLEAAVMLVLFYINDHWIEEEDGECWIDAAEDEE